MQKTERERIESALLRGFYPTPYTKQRLAAAMQRRAELIGQASILVNRGVGL